LRENPERDQPLEESAGENDEHLLRLHDASSSVARRRRPAWERLSGTQRQITIPDGSVVVV